MCKPPTKLDIDIFTINNNNGIIKELRIKIKELDKQITELKIYIKKLENNKITNF
jgi:hypothetical protein